MMMNKVIDYYCDIGYLCFLLETGEIKKFPEYWVFAPFGDAENHKELQELLSQTKAHKGNCIHCLDEIEYVFRPIELICVKCQCIQAIDAEIFQYVNLTKDLLGDKIK